ncbi:MAG: Acetyltransferase domain [Patescibacteria group bacterium]|nr:Acetyltransferase domain [Patescibacteria group bacterium]
MTTELSIIKPETSVDEVLTLSVLSGPTDEIYYKKIMLGFLANGLSEYPMLDLGIVYGLYQGETLIASARIKQEEATFPAVTIEYVAVKSELRGQGHGKTFMEKLFQEIKNRWGKNIAMLATGESKGFYERIGMKILGELGGLGYPRYYFYKVIEEN